MSPQPLNVFPAKLVADGIQYSQARVFVTGERALIFSESPNTPKVERMDVEKIEGRASKTSASVVTFADGTTWEVYRAGGCGCGNSLKRFNARRWM